MGTSVEQEGNVCFDSECLPESDSENLSRLAVFRIPWSLRALEERRGSWRHASRRRAGIPDDEWRARESSGVHHPGGPHAPRKLDRREYWSHSSLDVFFAA